MTISQGTTSASRPKCRNACAGDQADRNAVAEPAPAADESVNGDGDSIDDLGIRAVGAGGGGSFRFRRFLPGSPLRGLDRRHAPDDAISHGAAVSSGRSMLTPRPTRRPVIASAIRSQVVDPGSRREHGVAHQGGELLAGTRGKLGTRGTSIVVMDQAGAAD
jgi:hypothetical protein